MVQHRCPDTRWAWVEIDKGALRRNTRAFKDLLEPGVRMMAVVKADAYGHGAVECAKVMRAAGADQFAVATVEEGLELREAGITWPILILSEPPMECVQTLVEHDLMPCVYTQEFALAYGECAAALGTVGKYHLSVETGMTRIGVGWKDAVEFRRGIDFHRGLKCAGTLTHFATADVPGDWTFALQYRRFTEAVSAMRDAGIDCGLVHCDNTPATILYPDTHLDMCRVGVGLYGMQPAESTRPEIYIANVVKCRPPGNRNPKPAEIQECAPFLREQIRSIWPDVIVCLGNFASQWVLKTDRGVTSLRGQLYQQGHFVVCPPFHPAACIYHADWQPLLENDLRMVGAWLAAHPAATAGVVPASEAAGRKAPAGAGLPEEPAADAAAGVGDGREGAR